TGPGLALSHGADRLAVDRRADHAAAAAVLDVGLLVEAAARAARPVAARGGALPAIVVRAGDVHTNIEAAGAIGAEHRRAVRVDLAAEHARVTRLTLGAIGTIGALVVIGHAGEAAPGGDITVCRLRVLAVAVGEAAVADPRVEVAAPGVTARGVNRGATG